MKKKRKYTVSCEHCEELIEYKTADVQIGHRMEHDRELRYSDVDRKDVTGLFSFQPIYTYSGDDVYNETTNEIAYKYVLCSECGFKHILVDNLSKKYITSRSYRVPIDGQDAEVAHNKQVYEASKWVG